MLAMIEQKKEQSTSRMLYKIDNHFVCRNTFMLVYGMTKEKLNILKNTKINGFCSPTTPRTMRLTYKPKSQLTCCKVFLTVYFDENCQIPREGLRLSPVYLPLIGIYQMVFIP